MKTRAWPLALVILAACTSASAPGSQDVVGQVDKAKHLEIDTALQRVVSAQENIHAETGAYTNDLAKLIEQGVSVPAGTSLVVARGDASGYCVQASHEELGGPWHVSNTQPTVTDGAC